MFGLRRGHAGEITLDALPALPADAVEMARFWVSAREGRSYVATSTYTQWAPELLGSLLVEAARTAASGFATATGMTEMEAFAQIMKGMDAERAGLASEGNRDDQA
ncbi:MAG: DUF5076 domain-containing protein [Novosphingobium sp.]|nr:DUF5076 domain-containing protein [Novosphingobium sp.]